MFPCFCAFGAVFGKCFLHFRAQFAACLHLLRCTFCTWAVFAAPRHIARRLTLPKPKGCWLCRVTRHRETGSRGRSGCAGAQLLLLSLLSQLSLLRAGARTHAPKGQQQPQRMR